MVITICIWNEFFRQFQIKKVILFYVPILEQRSQNVLEKKNFFSILCKNNIWYTRDTLPVRITLSWDALLSRRRNDAKRIVRNACRRRTHDRLWARRSFQDHECGARRPAHYSMTRLSQISYNVRARGYIVFVVREVHRDITIARMHLTYPSKMVRTCFSRFFFTSTETTRDLNRTPCNGCDRND